VSAHSPWKSLCSPPDIYGHGHGPVSRFLCIAVTVPFRPCARYEPFWSGPASCADTGAAAEEPRTTHQVRSPQSNYTVSEEFLCGCGGRDSQRERERARVLQFFRGAAAAAAMFQLINRVLHDQFLLYVLKNRCKTGFGVVGCLYFILNYITSDLSILSSPQSHQSRQSSLSVGTNILDLIISKFILWTTNLRELTKYIQLQILKFT
jgi:hypothetical protein